MQQYVAITKDTLIENTAVGCDLYLKSYVNGVLKYVLFCREEEHLSRDKKELLLGKNIQRLYILSKDYQKYFRYQERNLPNILANNDVSSREKSHAVYHVAKNLTKDILRDIGTTGVDLERVRNWVKYTMSFILNDKYAFSGLVSMTSHDYYTYTHSINLSVLGLLFGKHLCLDPDSLSTFGTGMLLHDVGKVKVPLEILNKPGKLSKDEYEVLKEHPVAGYNLLKYKKNLDEKTLIPTIQHHENYDGSGYPYGLSGKEIDLYGRLSRIIDIYDAITTRRCYAGAMSPFAALNEMRECMINCLDRELFREFIRFLGPVESRIVKENGEIVSLTT